MPTLLNIGTLLLSQKKLGQTFTINTYFKRILILCYTRDFAIVEVRLVSKVSNKCFFSHIFAIIL